MALGDSYVDATALKAYLGIDDANDDSLLTVAGKVGSQWVNRHCGRQFNKTTTASARVYRAERTGVLAVDDFHTTTDLVVKTDTGDNGTYDTTWTTSDYVLEPFNGVRDGETGFPYEKILAVEGLLFPTSGHRARVEVTAQWGWNAVPDAVTRAATIVAALVHNMKDSPLGVASFADAGLIRVRDVPAVVPMMLERYRHPRATALVA